MKERNNVKDEKEGEYSTFIETMMFQMAHLELKSMSLVASIFLILILLIPSFKNEYK